MGYTLTMNDANGGFGAIVSEMSADLDAVLSNAGVNAGRVHMEASMVWQWLRQNISDLIDPSTNSFSPWFLKELNKHGINNNLAIKNKGDKYYIEWNDVNGVKQAYDLLGNIIKIMKSQKTIVGETHIPYRVGKKVGDSDTDKGIYELDSDNYDIVRFPVGMGGLSSSNSPVNFPMLMLYFDPNVFGGRAEDQSKPFDDGLESELFDSVERDDRNFVHRSIIEANARAIYGDRFVDGFLEFKPASIDKLYGLMRDGRVQLYYDSDGNVSEGTEHHEVMHWVMLHVLDRESYRRVIEEARELMSQRDRVPPDSISEVDLNEFIAEEYRKRPKPVSFFTRVLSFIRKVLWRIGLYKPSIDRLFEMTSAGQMTNPDLFHAEPNFSQALADSDVPIDFDVEAVESIQEEGAKNGAKEFNSANVIATHIPSIYIPYLRASFLESALRFTEYAPPPTVDGSVRFSSSPSRLSPGSINELLNMYIRKRQNLIDKHSGIIFHLPDRVDITFDQITVDNLPEVWDAIKSGRVTATNEMAKEILKSPGGILRSFIEASVGKDFNEGTGRGSNHIVFRALVNSLFGNIRYEVDAGTDIQQQQKSYRQGDASSDSREAFSEESAIVKAILTDRPLLFEDPVHAGDPARSIRAPGRYRTASGGFITVKPSVMKDVMSNAAKYALESILQDGGTGTPTFNDIYRGIRSRLYDMYMNAPNSSYGRHAFTAYQILFGEGYLAGNVLIPSYGKAFAVFNTKELKGIPLTPIEEAWKKNIEATLNNIISAFISVSETSVERSIVRPGKRKRGLEIPGEERSYWPSSQSFVRVDADIRAQVKNGINNAIKSAWVGRGGTGFMYREIWRHFDVTGRGHKDGDRPEFRIDNSNGSFSVSAYGNDGSLIELARMDYENKRSPQPVINKQILIARTQIERNRYVDLIQKFFQLNGWGPQKNTIHNLLYGNISRSKSDIFTATSHELLAKGLIYWSLATKRGMIQIAERYVRNLPDQDKAGYSAKELLNSDTEEMLGTEMNLLRGFRWDSSVWKGRKIGGFASDTIGEIVNGKDDDSVDGTSGGTQILPTDLYRLNEALFMEDQLHSANPMNRRFKNGDGGASEIRTKASWLKTMIERMNAPIDIEKRRMFMESILGSELMDSFKLFEHLGATFRLSKGMSRNDSGEGSRYSHMTARDITFMNADRFLKSLVSIIRSADSDSPAGGYLEVPTFPIGDRDDGLVANIRIGTRNFKDDQFSGIIKVKWGNGWRSKYKDKSTGKFVSRENDPNTNYPVEGFDIDMNRYLNAFIMPQMRKFEALQNQSVSRIKDSFDQAMSILIDNGMVSDRFSELDKLNTLVQKTNDRSAWVKSIGEVIRAINARPENERKAFAIALRSTGIQLGRDLTISKDFQIGPGSQLLFNHNRVFNFRTNARLKYAKNDKERAEILISIFERPYTYTDKTGKEVSIPWGVVGNVRRQWRRSGVSLSYAFRSMVDFADSDTRVKQGERARVFERKDDGTFEARVPSTEEQVIWDAARVYTYMKFMVDTYAMDMIAGGHGHMIKPDGKPVQWGYDIDERIPGRNPSAPLWLKEYIDTISRMNTTMSSGTRPVPSDYGIAPTIRVAVYDDIDHNGVDAYDGANVMLPHFARMLRHSLGGESSIASETPFKPITFQAGMVNKRSDITMTAELIAINPKFAEIAFRTYSLHPNEAIRNAWAPVVAMVGSGGVLGDAPVSISQLDMESFQRVYDNAVDQIINILRGTDDNGVSLKESIVDIASPTSGQKTLHTKVQYLNVNKNHPKYSGVDISPLTMKALEPSITYRADSTYYQLNKDRDANAQLAPAQTQLRAWLGETLSGYNVMRNAYSSLFKYTVNRASEILNAIGMDMENNVDAEQGRRAHDYIKGKISSVISPDNYMGDMLAILRHPDTSIDNPMVSNIVRNTLGQLINKQIISPRINGELMVSIPGYDMMVEEEVVVQSTNADGTITESRTTSVRPMKEDECLIPFRYAQHMLPKELQEKARYMTFQQVKQAVMEKAMADAARMFPSEGLEAVRNEEVSRVMAEFDRVMTVMISRTPANGAASAMALKVVGFMNSQGNSIAVHPEINKRTGADHEIDEWTVHMYAVERFEPSPGSGVSSWRILRGDPTNDRKALSNLLLDSQLDYYSNPDAVIQDRIFNRMIGTEKFSEAFQRFVESEIGKKGASALARGQLNMADLEPESISLINIGKELVGAFMNVSKSYAYMMHAYNAWKSAGGDIQSFQSKFSPGLQLFEDGLLPDGNTISEALSAISNQALDDTKQGMKIGSIGINLANVNVYIGGILKGIPMEQVFEMSQWPAMKRINDIIEWRGNLTRNEDTMKMDVIDALERISNESGEIFGEMSWRDQIEEIRDRYFIGFAMNRAGVVFSQDSRKSPSNWHEQESTYQKIFELTGKRLRELWTGKEMSVEEKNLEPYEIWLSANREKRKRVMKGIMERFRFDLMLSPGSNLDNGDVSLHGRRMLLGMMLEKSLTDATRLTSSRGAKILTRAVIAQTNRKNPPSKGVYDGIEDTLIEAAIQRSIELLPDVGNNDPLSVRPTGGIPGRIVHLRGKKFDLATIEGQAGFMRLFPVMLHERLNTIAQDPSHPAYDHYVMNRFLNGLDFQLEGSGMFGFRDSTFVREPAEKIAIREDYKNTIMATTDKNGIMIGDQESDFSDSHGIRELLAFYSALNDKMSIKRTSFATFIPVNDITWVDNGFKDLYRIMQNIESSSLSMPDGSIISGQDYLNNTLIPAAMMKPGVRSAKRKRDAASLEKALDPVRARHDAPQHRYSPLINPPPP